jgi:hypothetical protein
MVDMHLVHYLDFEILILSSALIDTHTVLSSHMIQSAVVYAICAEIQELKKLIQDIQEKEEQDKPW